MSCYCLQRKWFPLHAHVLKLKSAYGAWLNQYCRELSQLWAKVLSISASYAQWVLWHQQTWGIPRWCSLLTISISLLSVLITLVLILPLCVGLAALELYRAPVKDDVKCSVLYFCKFALSPFSPPLPSVVEFSEQNRHWTFDIILYWSPVEY